MVLRPQTLLARLAALASLTLTASATSVHGQPAEPRATSAWLGASLFESCSATHAKGSECARELEPAPEPAPIAAAVPSPEPRAPHPPRPGADDPRLDYDVTAYRLDLEVDPRAERITGSVAIELRVVRDSVDEIVLDLDTSLAPARVRLATAPLDGDSPLIGRVLDFRHDTDRLHCRLPAAARDGDTLRLVIDYSGSPRAHDRMSGFHWGSDPQGRPWIATSCQLIGAHTWWPCKANFFHPEDRCERLWMNVRAPRDLVVMSNGRLVGQQPEGESQRRWSWFLDAPISTYGVALAIGDYTTISSELTLQGLERPVPLRACVLPEFAEAAEVQFEELPQLLDTYAEAFGPYPFPEAKVGIAQTPFIGMEHSTAIAYGSTFPRWREREGLADPCARYNRHYDHVLAHQFAHEWWGNHVAAASWEDIWLHEGFATYAESLWLEAQRGRPAADEYFQEQKPKVRCDSALIPAAFASFRDAYSSGIYVRGSWVLNTLRHFVDDDEAWFGTLRRFQREHGRGVATTADFQRTLEEVTGREWETFFLQWVRGRGYPRLSGEVRVDGTQAKLCITNIGTAGTDFDVPLELRWREGCREVQKRIELVPGTNPITIEGAEAIEGLQILGLERILCDHRIRIR